MRARARHTDALSSWAAAKDIEATGKAEAQRKICLRAVVDYPGRTSRELAEILPLDRYQIARRLPELRDAGLIAEGPLRRCRVAGLLALTWIPRYCQGPLGL